MTKITAKYVLLFTYGESLIPFQTGIRSVSNHVRACMKMTTIREKTWIVAETQSNSLGALRQGLWPAG